MKKVRKIVYCSRCGDEISAEELALLSGTTCALCSHMQQEARQIHQEKRKSAIRLPLLHTVSIISR
ncbi:MAG: hypothetical protein M0R33_11050 [Methylomonas sp.]|jgi:RNA polymerase-binding transcription factor DksA|uniref:hypothetical protein n=1 Tax=Methylomonas sp. TaxID=418 RepID=UPI0025F33B5B|nr:hypothetical protein [Methylomonas sp.]MCK9606969.1 hypothetical protein [Methylomonas sp.]